MEAEKHPSYQNASELPDRLFEFGREEMEICFWKGPKKPFCLLENVSLYSLNQTLRKHYFKNKTKVIIDSDIPEF